MKATIIIHRPDLSPEERAYRMEKIKQATINFHKEVNEHEQKRKETVNSFSLGFFTSSILKSKTVLILPFNLEG